MNYFLGFFPDDDSRKKISDVAVGVKDVFEGFDIKVRWSQPKSYHITVLFLGTKFPFPKVLMCKQKLKKFSFRKFKVRFNSIKLGISRKYRELLYLDLLEGGDEMRQLHLELRNITGTKEDTNFIPHLTLGRINKDLSTQEYMNIAKDLSVVTKKLKVNKIEFEVQSIDLVKSEEGLYSIQVSINGV